MNLRPFDESTPADQHLEFFLGDKKIVFPFSESSEEAFFKKIHFLREGVFLARDLINDNADSITPEKIGEVAKNLAKEHQSLKVKVFDKEEIQEMNMGLHAVRQIRSKSLFSYTTFLKIC